MARSLAFRSGLLSLLILTLFLGVWHLATLSPTSAPVAAAPVLTADQLEYAKLIGKDPTASAAPAAKPGFPTLAQMGTVMVRHLSSPFYDNGPNDSWSTSRSARSMR